MTPSALWLKRAVLLLPFLLPAYVMRFSIGPLPTTLLELALGALVIGWLAVRRMDGVRSVWKQLQPWRIPVGLWIAAGALGVLTTQVNGFDVLAALGLFRAYFLEPLLIFAIGLDVLRTEKDRTELLHSITLVAVILATIAVVQYATGWGIPHPWDTWPGRRSTGPFPFPNALALFLVPFGTLGAALLIHGRERFIAALLFGCALLAAFLAQSDGGLIALGAALGCALLFKKQTRVPALLAAALLVVVSLTVAPLREKVLFQEWSGKVRLVMWEETITLINEYPVFGAGLAAYPQAILPYHTATWMEVFQYPHNIVLNLWTELGLPGLVAFAVLLFYWVRYSRQPATVLPVILALLVHGLVDVPYFKNDLAVAFWLLVLLTLTTASPRKTA